jgi:hypothetical protein
VLETSKAITRQTFWKMNLRHFEVVKENIQVIWQTQLKCISFTKMEKNIKYYKEFCKRKATYLSFM